MAERPAERAHRVVDCCRFGELGRPTVVDGQNGGVAPGGQPPAYPVVRVQVAQHEATAVGEQHERARLRARPVEPPSQNTVDGHVLDPGQIRSSRAGRGTGLGRPPQRLHPQLFAGWAPIASQLSKPLGQSLVGDVRDGARESVRDSEILPVGVLGISVVDSGIFQRGHDTVKQSTRDRRAPTLGLGSLPTTRT